MKKTFAALAMSAVLLSNMGVAAYAVPVGTSSSSEQQLVGLAASSSITRDAHKPVSAYDVGANGSYELSGSSDSTDLYSLYYFTGKSVYHLGFHNRQGTKQKFICRAFDDDKKLYSDSVPGSNASTSGTYSCDLKTDKGWYIVFPNTVFGDGVDIWANIY